VAVKGGDASPVEFKDSKKEESRESKSDEKGDDLKKNAARQPVQSHLDDVAGSLNKRQRSPHSSSGGE